MFVGSNAIDAVRTSPHPTVLLYFKSQFEFVFLNV